MPKNSSWSDTTEVGFFAGMRILFWLSRHSAGLLKLVLQPVVFYYFVTNKVARDSSLNYFRHLYSTDTDAHACKPNWRNVYRHLLSFAYSILDKLSVWAGPKDFVDIKFPTRQVLLDQIDTGQGAILLGAHLGNMEVCRQISTKNQKMKLNILVHTKHAEKFNRLLKKFNIHHEIELIEVSELSPATAIRLSNCVAQGEFVAILADRIPVASRGRSQAVSFLGEEAFFPEGPFILASLLKCPVYTLFCTRQGAVYDITCEKFAEQVILPRAERSSALKKYIQKFAETLEKNIRKTPMQWFNFYPFWNRPS